jgi:hypothetical protein
MVAQRSQHPAFGNLNCGLNGCFHVRRQLPAVASVRNDSV